MYFTEEDEELNEEEETVEDKQDNLSLSDDKSGPSLMAISISIGSGLLSMNLPVKVRLLLMTLYSTVYCTFTCYIVT